MRGTPAPATCPQRRGPRSAGLAGLLLAGLLLAAGAAAPAARAALIEPAPVVRIDGEPYIGVNAVAERLGATKYWRADVRKLVLRAGAHRVQLTVDNRFVLVDDRVVQLARPVRSRRGEVQVPVELLDLLPRDSSLTRLVYDPATGAVGARPPGGSVGTPRVTVEGALTRVEFPVEEGERLAVVRRDRAHFQVRFDGFYGGRPTPPLPAGSLVRSMRALPVPVGSALALDVAPQATGYRVVREGSSAIALEFWAREGPGLEPFAPEDRPGPRPVRVVVLDPGHGGPDGGARGGERVEKDLTLQLARLLKAELERRLPLRVVLARDGDAAVGADRRAEIANRARADVVISLHFDGAPVPGARGATAYCAPAVLGGGTGAGRSGAASTIEALPWRDVALRHAVPARSLAEAVAAALELGGQGPARVVEKLPAPLLGVNAPGILLECATLTAPADQARLTSEGLRALAAAIAAGLETYRRND